MLGVFLDKLLFSKKILRISIKIRMLVNMDSSVYKDFSNEIYLFIWEYWFSWRLILVH